MSLFSVGCKGMEIGTPEELSDFPFLASSINVLGFFRRFVFHFSKFSTQKLENGKVILELPTLQDCFCALLPGRVCGAACSSSDLQNHWRHPGFLHLPGGHSRASSPGVPAGTFTYRGYALNRFFHSANIL